MLSWFFSTILPAWSGPAAAWLFDLSLKASILLIPAWFLGYLLRRTEARTQRLWWIATLAGVLSLPILSPWMPSWNLPFLPSLSPATRVSHSSGAPVREGPDLGIYHPVGESTRDLSANRAAGEEIAAAGKLRSRPVPSGEDQSSSAYRAYRLQTGLGFIALLGWVLGSAAVFSRFLAGLYRARQFARRALPVADPGWREVAAPLLSRITPGRRIALLKSCEIDTPMTWGWLRPVILVPAEAETWSAERRGIVLSHELVHVKRNDWIFQVLAHLACSFYWFHPLVWAAARRWSIERERACDEAVLSLGTRPSLYARHLLDITRSISPQIPAATATLAMARRCRLEDRLMAILDSNPQRRRRVLLTVVAFTLMAFLVVTASTVQSGEATPAPPSPPESPAEETSAPAAMPLVPLPIRLSAPLPPVISPIRLSVPLAPVDFPPGGPVIHAPAPLSPGEGGHQDIRFRPSGIHGNHTRIHHDDGEYVITRSRDGFRIQLRVNGEVEFADGGKGIRTMAPTAYVVLEAGSEQARQRLEISGEEDGALHHEWSINGRSRPFDDDARDWMEEMLAIFSEIRRSAELREESNALQGRIHALHGREYAMHGQIHSLHGRKAAMQGRIHAQHGQNKAFQGQIHALQGRHNALSAKMLSLKSQAARLQVFRLSMGIPVDGRNLPILMEIDAEIEAISHEIEEMELQIESLQVKAADEEVRRQLEVMEIDRQIAEVGEPMIDVEIDRQVAEFERKIAEFEQEMIHLDAENRALEIEENLQARIDKIKKISDRFSRDRR